MIDPILSHEWTPVALEMYLKPTFELVKMGIH